MAYLREALDIGEAIAESAAPTLALSIFLLVVVAGTLWATLRRQRKWVTDQFNDVRAALDKCEVSHRLCIAQGQRRTSLLLQILAIAEPLVVSLRRSGDAAKLSIIRAEVRVLLDEETAEARSHTRGTH